jgi:putative transposase
MTIASFYTDLSDAQWKLLRKLLPKARKLGRKPACRRRILNALLYLNKAGCPWRLLPHCFGPWKTAYHVFRQWACNGTLRRLNDRLRIMVRHVAGKRGRPTAAILDSQSVKSAAHGGDVGYDAAKRIKGRKRHILVDTLGLLISAVVSPASIPERAGGLHLLRGCAKALHWLQLLWVDAGYSGPEFAAEVGQIRPQAGVEVVRRSDDTTGFKVLPRRWLVERTFGWLMLQRRLVRDYEQTDSSAEAFIYLAMIRIQLRRLA